MRIRTRGFKAHDQDVDLAAHTLLVGPNGRGKSTIFDGIRFLGVGYVPALGKRPVDTAALMQNGVMSVELVIPNIGTARRSIERQGSGFTIGADASWIRNARPTEVGKQITALFGNEELDVAESLDIRQLLAATPNQRAARIEQLLASGQKSAEEKAGDVARFIVMRLAETSEERMPEDWKKAAAMIPEPQMAVLEKQEKMLVDKIREAGLGGALTWANDEKKRSADGARKKQAAESELRTRAAEIPQPSDIEIERLENERDQVQQGLGAARERATSAQRQKDTRAAAEQENRGAQAAWDDAKTVRDGVQPRLEELPKLREQLAAAKAESDKVGHEPPQQEENTEAADLERQSRELSDLASSIEKKIPAHPDVDGPRARVKELEDLRDSLAKSPWAEVRTIGKRLAKEKKEALMKDGDRLIEIAAHGLKQSPELVAEQLDKAKDELERAEQDDLKVGEIDLQKKEEMKDLLQRAAELMSRARKSREDKRAAFLKTYEDWQQKVRQLAGRKVTLEEQVKAIEEQDRRTAATLDRAATSAKSAAKRLEDLGAAPAAEAAAGFEDKTRELALVQDRLKNLNQARAIHAEIRQTLASIEAAQAELKVFSAIEWGLQRQRDKEISEAGGPLLRHLGEFLAGAGRKEIPFIRASAGACNIGWKTPDGREIQIQALSGGEWCLFAGGLTLAVILSRPSTLKVLLVEAAEADPETLGQLLAGIRKINGEELVTCVVASPHADGVHPDGWTVVELGQPVEAGGA